MEQKSMTLMCLLIIVKGIGIGFFACSREALLLAIGGSEENYKTLDGVHEKLYAICKFTAPIAAALLVIYLPYATGVLLTAGVYGLAALLTLGLPLPQVTAQQAQEQEENPAAFGEGVAYVMQNPVLYLGLLMIAIATFVVTVGDSQLVIFFRQLPQAGADTVAGVMSASGLGAFLLGTWYQHEKWRARTLLCVILSALGLGLTFAGVAWLMQSRAPLWYFYPLFFFGGLAWQIGYSAYFGALAQDTPKRLLNQAMTFIGSVVVLTYTLGPLAGGVCVSLLQVIPTFYLCGAALIISALISTPFMRAGRSVSAA